MKIILEKKEYNSVNPSTINSNDLTINQTLSNAKFKNLQV
tara:strand:- start:367884 stop:368003 length:120 start_codon:yes stop_codon:yes gene_type:complete